MTVLGAVLRYIFRRRTRQITGMHTKDFIVIDSNGNAGSPIAIEQLKPGTYQLTYSTFPLK